MIRGLVRSFAALLADHVPKPTVTIQCGPASINFAAAAPAPSKSVPCSCPIGGEPRRSCLRHGSIGQRRP